jgi:hypothetical protein
MDCRSQPRTSAADNALAVYEVVVELGETPSSSTGANLFIRINGRTNRVPRQKLVANIVETADGRRLRYLAGTKNVFKIRGPSLTHVHSVVIESDGITEDDGCLIKSVSVENLRARLIWEFDCNEWLSLYHGDCKISRQLFVDAPDKSLYQSRSGPGGPDIGGTES